MQESTTIDAPFHGCGQRGRGWRAASGERMHKRNLFGFPQFAGIPETVSTIPSMFSVSIGELNSSEPWR